jgi:hypothetical protein
MFVVGRGRGVEDVGFVKRGDGVIEPSKRDVDQDHRFGFSVA